MSLRWWGSRPFFGLLGLLIAVLAAATVGLFGLDLWSGPAMLLSSSSKLAFLVAAAVYAFACVRRGDSMAWRLMAGGFLGYSIAQGILLGYSLSTRESPPFPSWADLFFIGGSIVLVLALWIFLLELGRSGCPLDLRRRLLIDGLWIFGAGGLGVWMVMGTVLGAAENRQDAWFSAVYPIIDLLLLMPALLLFQATRPFRGGRVRHVWSTLLIGMALFLVGDLLFAVLAGGIDPWLGWAVDVSYLAGYALCARACALQLEMMS